MGKPDQPRGPDGRWIPRGGGALIAAIALALGLASGTGLTSASGASGGTSGTYRPQDTTKSQKARDRNPERLLSRLARQGLRVEQRFSSDDGDCAAHSYGLVREFFRGCPCSALFRALFEVRDERGNVVLVAVAWVDMPDVRRAREFKELVDRDGTGNITELSRETGPYQDVRYTGDHYASIRDETTVINAQAQPVRRSRPATDLAERVVSAVLTP
ncbi:hypothetical protein FHX44_111551 [Pseudonocardia hierapolitana]|uniref:Uncharacterized protein n=1 Tax=Pseudonocardia hierapolitana TaxID=1128676 RepID=A0A561SLD1_9PSEU|nr:hypothetical protein [Pseudonocardia hierapolitana]TWF75667.1 hypothetical protein FHX44_111551 [Pseudonocardia hierapolitana]